MEVEWTFESPT